MRVKNRRADNCPGCQARSTETLPEYAYAFLPLVLNPSGPPKMTISIKSIIFDWGRTLFDSETKKEFPEAESVLSLCAKKNYRLALVSLVESKEDTATLEERKRQIENSPLRKYFEFVSVTDTDKDKILGETVAKLHLPPEEILIVDDRTARGIRYGNLHGHPTVWLRKGKFADELPNVETGKSTYAIRALIELADILALGPRASKQTA